MTIPSPITASETWDTLTVGGLPFTGEFEFDGDLVAKKVDRRHAPGRTGARIRNRGYDLAKIQLRLGCYEDEHFAQLDAIVRLLFPRGNETVSDAAVACPHPALALASITEVYAEKMGALKKDSRDVWQTTIELVEYRPSANRPVAHTVQQRPDIAAANPTAFTGLDPVPPSAAPARAGGAGPQPD